MMLIVQSHPELIPPGMPCIKLIQSEIDAARRALELRTPVVVLGHGDCKPSNIIMSQDPAGLAKLIDFELGGPNYRGFDLMKLFRTAAGPSKTCVEYFLLAYAECFREKTTDSDVDALADETYQFEPLTWLEACVFFLTLPLFKPREIQRWNALAIDRWDKYQGTKWRLFD